MTHPRDEKTEKPTFTHYFFSKKNIFLYEQNRIAQKTRFIFKKKTHTSCSINRGNFSNNSLCRKVWWNFTNC